MAINLIEYAAVFQRKLDEQLTGVLTSGWMEPNAEQLQYSGGKYIKIPSILLQGLGNYDRTKGHPAGAITLAWEQVEMTQDRARKYLLDANDVDETNFVLSMGLVLGELQRVHVAPEIDAYRYAKIATLAIAAGNARDYTPAASTILSELQNDVALVQDKVGAGEQLVIIMPIPTASMLSQSSELTRRLDVATFERGEVKTTVKGLNGIPILEVPSDRMYSAITMLDGEASGEEDGGYEPAAGAKRINWIITPRRAPIAVAKTDAMRIFDPMTYQGAHAWSGDYSKYHELFLPANRLAAVRVCTRA